ncbi:hypothetical protein ACFOVU_11390 [Nocardiopsis sediminis]|uniref:Uncharacterized protein n=1 Tax=Nocardiopsis sediminis TaxID=1778267 RepID=A0ABV8FN91_9ACTN
MSSVALSAWTSEPGRPDHGRAPLASVVIIADRLSATVLLHRIKVAGNGVLDRRPREAPGPDPVTLLYLTLYPPVLAEQTLIDSAFPRSSAPKEVMSMVSGNSRPSSRIAAFVMEGDLGRSLQCREGDPGIDPEPASSTSRCVRAPHRVSQNRQSEQNHRIVPGVLRLSSRCPAR